MERACFDVEGARVTTTIYLVRHGEAAGSWDNALDPGLSERGAVQAAQMADRLYNEIPVSNLYCSPLCRTRETAEPLAGLWQKEAIITPELSEVPSDGVDFGDRRSWLTRVMAGTWQEQSDRLNGWRSAILDFTSGQKQDAVFVTHFVVINAIVGAIEESKNVIVFKPDHCSVTKIQVSTDGMSLIEKGREAVTVVK
ncbi:MAG: phosphoglycerate mutase [Sneathiella sp.]|nr:phosphoglycerate mutase [Sneathiella sp.]